MFNCFDEDKKDYSLHFDREYFLDNVMNYFDVFQNAHNDVSGYNDELEDNYQWRWDDFFDMMGF